MSTGDEILPEHLNLPEATPSLEQIERQLKHILANGSAAEQAALNQLLKNTATL